MSGGGVDAVDTAEIREGVESSLGTEVKLSMFHAAAKRLEQQGEPDVREARMAMWQKIHSALPPGKLKEWHGRTEWFAELDARVAGWSGEGKAFLWKITKSVIAADFPPALLIPDNAPSILDAWSARLGGMTGELAIRGGMKMYEAGKAALSGARQRIDQLVARVASGTAMRPVTQGGTA